MKKENNFQDNSELENNKTVLSLFFFFINKILNDNTSAEYNKAIIPTQNTVRFQSIIVQLNSYEIKKKSLDVLRIQQK